MMEIRVPISAGEEGQVKIKDAGHKLLDFGSFLSKVSDLFNFIKRYFNFVNVFLGLR